MHLVFDTETTGMANFKAPASDPSQPFIVQLGAILYDDNKRVVAEMNLLVKPDGWTIPPEASAIHGITTEMCEKYGLPLVTVIKLFMTFVKRASILIAHNFPFDKMLVWASLLRLQLAPEIVLFLEAKSHCTMAASTDVLKLPGKYGSYKWPNLQEAHVHFTGARFEGAHDAMADVRACAAIYFALMATAQPPAPVPVQPVIEE